MRLAIHIIWAAEKDATAAEQPLSALMSQSESASLDDVDLKSVCCSLLGVGQAYVRRMVKPSQRHISGFFDCTHPAGHEIARHKNGVVVVLAGVNGGRRVAVQNIFVRL